MNPLATTRLNPFYLPTALLQCRGPTSLLRPHSGSFFSTSTRLLETNSNPTPNGTEPSIFKRLGATPRTRVFLIGCFVVLASVETLGWFNFGPKILGWDKSGEEKCWKLKKGMFISCCMIRLNGCMKHGCSLPGLNMGDDAI